MSTNLPLNPDELSILHSLLNKLEPGFYPLDLFHHFARLMTLATAIVVPIYIERGEAKVVLYRRSVDDLFWPHQLDVPGCVVRPSDSEKDVLNRIIGEEIGLEPNEITPVYAATDIRTTRRGNEVATVYYAVLPSKPIGSVLSDPSSLPDDFINLDKRPVELAVGAYERDALYSDHAASAE